MDSAVKPKSNLFGFANLIWDNRGLGKQPMDRKQSHGARHETTQNLVVRPPHFPCD